jgi:hypothetical protein
MKKTFFFIIIVSFFIITQVTASEIFLEHAGEKSYISLRSDVPVNISGYYLQLNISPGTRIESLDILPPFEGAANIQNEQGWAKIAAFTAGSSSSNRLAEISYSGDGKIEIIVFELDDENLNPVRVDNMVIPTETPEATPSLPPYNILPQYGNSGDGASLNPAIQYSVQQTKSPVPLTAMTEQQQNPQKTQSPGQQEPSVTIKTPIQGTIVPAVTGAEQKGPVQSSSIPAPSQTQKAPLLPVSGLFALVIVILGTGMQKIRNK